MPRTYMAVFVGGERSGEERRFQDAAESGILPPCLSRLLTQDTGFKPFMPTVRVKENEPFEVALRRFKRTVEKTGLLTELRAREFYEKPTAERKRKLAAAVKRHHKRLRSQMPLSAPLRFPTTAPFRTRFHPGSASPIRLRGLCGRFQPLTWPP